MSNREIQNKFEADAKFLRETFNIRDGEPIVIWEYLGIQGCPLDFSRSSQGLANCPLGFGNMEKPPHEPQPWMRGRREDKSWKEPWREILVCCCECQGKGKPTDEQKTKEILGFLFERRH
jgi:hypothetical protein